MDGAAVAFLAGHTFALFPAHAVLQSASVVDLIIIFRTFRASYAIHLHAAFNRALASFQREVDEAISALPSLISHAAQLHTFAVSLSSQIVPALASSTAVVVIGLAVRNSAVAIVEREKRVALLANVIDLIFAADYRILNTEVVVKTESLLAVGTDCSASVDELDTIFDGFRASSSFEVVA